MGHCGRSRSWRGKRRRGAALLVCFFISAMAALIVVAVFDTETLQMTALRNTLNYERAYCLACAGAHHALAMLEADSTWRTGISSTEFPSGSGYTYSATAVDGTGGQVTVTGIGVAGGVTRKVQVTVDFGS